MTTAQPAPATRQAKTAKAPAHGASLIVKQVDTTGIVAGLTRTLRDLSVPERVAIFASKSHHCLLDLLWRHRQGPLSVSIPW
jgi:formyltetrahydrofolate hydrolase